MVQINFAQKTVSVKIVYYGPGMCGKTTNLQIIHDKVPAQSKGKMASLATSQDRTLFFDFLQRRILKKLHRKLEGTRNPWDDALVQATLRPLSLLIWLLGITFAADIARIAPDADLAALAPKWMETYQQAKANPPPVHPL